MIRQKCGLTAHTSGRRARQRAGFGHAADSCVWNALLFTLPRDGHASSTDGSSPRANACRRWRCNRGVRSATRPPARYDPVGQRK